jgi:hypothetical protein
MTTSVLNKEVRQLRPAEEVAMLTRRLLGYQGWCRWQCEMLGGEIIIVVKNEMVRGYPEGLPVYTEREIVDLVDMGEDSVLLIHEAKKMDAAFKGTLQEALL